MRNALLFAIRMYQRTLSPDHGWFRGNHPYGFCRFYPTCSMYAYRAVERFGVFHGLWMALRRVLRCHPWSEGGIDPVPEKITIK